MPGFAVAVTGVLVAPERQVDFGADRRRVYVDDAGVDVVHRAHRGVDVARVDGGRQAVLAVVHGVDRVVVRVDLDHREHRTEHLVAGDERRPLRAPQDGGREERTTVAAVDDDGCSTAHQVVALGHGAFDHRSDAIERSGRDHRTDVGARREWVTEAQIGRTLGESAHHFVGDAALHHESRRRRAPLA